MPERTQGPELGNNDSSRAASIPGGVTSYVTILSSGLSRCDLVHLWRPKCWSTQAFVVIRVRIILYKSCIACTHFARMPVHCIIGLFAEQESSAFEIQRRRRRNKVEESYIRHDAYNIGLLCP